MLLKDLLSEKKEYDKKHKCLTPRRSPPTVIRQVR
jgi:hypothetical protein